MPAKSRRFHLLIILWLGLTACGPDGADGPETDTISDTISDTSNPVEIVLKPLRGTVTLGANWTAARVNNGFAEVPVVDGAFTIDHPEGDRLLAVVTTPAGNPVALAWLGPEHTVIDARSTVEVIAHFALGGYRVPREHRAHLLDLLDAAPELDAVADELRRMGFKYPDGFTGALDYSLEAKLETACQAILKSPVARAVLINPSDERSGIVIDNLSGLEEVTFTNRFRRRAYAYIDRVGITRDGVETAVDEPFGRFELSPVTGLRNEIGTVRQLVIGAMDSRLLEKNDDVSYVPRSYGPMPLPNAVGAESTRYRVAIVGPGDKAGDYDRLRDYEQLQQSEVALDFLVRDYIIPFLTDVIAPTQLILSEEAQSESSELIKAALRSDPDIKDSYAFGKPAQLLQIILGYGAYESKLPIALIEKAFQIKFGKQLTSEQWTKLEMTKSTLRVFNGVNVGLKLIDSALIERDMAFSSRADIWDLVVTKANVRLDPAESTIAPGDYVTLTASVSGAGDNDVFEYRYTTGGTAGTLNSATQRGNDITSDVEFVTYDATEIGEDTITVAVFAVRGDERIGVGTASAKVTVGGAGVKISPNDNPEVEAFGSLVFTATAFGDELPEILAFEWKTEGEHGDFGGQATAHALEEDGVHEVAFTAGFVPGRQDIIVEISAPGATEPIARSRVGVRVKPMRAVITPATAELRTGAEVALTAAVTPNPPRGTLTYRWSVVGYDGLLDGASTVTHDGTAATDTVTYRAPSSTPTSCVQVVTLDVEYQDGARARALLPTRARMLVECPMKAEILAARDVIATDSTMNVTCQVTSTGAGAVGELTYAWTVTSYGGAHGAIAGTGRTAKLSAGSEAGELEVVCAAFRDGEKVAEAEAWFRVYEEPEPPCQEAFDHAFWNEQNGGMAMTVSGKLGGRVTVDVYVPSWTDNYSMSVMIARGTGTPVVTGPDGVINANVERNVTTYTDVMIDDGGAKVRVSGARVYFSSKGATQIEMDTLPLDPACESTPFAEPCCPYAAYESNFQRFVLTGPLVVGRVTTGVNSGRSGGVAVGVLQSQ